ncbi:ATP-binding protein [Streptomyces sp. NPDC057002]|uniref:ATP-binding protein n=1 Tax=Streptomyces sp. NPDC057002 TaxID=3345992 RepID=UPI0036306984
MSSPAQHVLRPPSGAAAYASAPGTSHGLPPGPHTLTPYEATPYGTIPMPVTRPVRLGLRLDPTHLPVTVSDPDDRPPVHTPADGSAPEEHGRGLCIVDALSEERGWIPCPPAGKTVRARSSTCPPI